MNKRMKVLIGYDGSSYAEDAIDDLRHAGLPSDAEALVVSVGDSPIVPPLASHMVIERAFIGERVAKIVEHANKQSSHALQQSKDLASKASARLKSYFPNWHVRGKAVAGVPAWELVRKAEDWRSDLIVVGSQGRSAIGRLILGSVSLEVARDARCSVRIGRYNAEKSDRVGQRILIGLNGSPQTETVIPMVLMRQWPHGTELRIVAVDDGTRPLNVGSTTERSGRRDTAVTSVSMITLATTKSLRVSAAIRDGDPERVLLAEAREWEADCIFIGSAESSNRSEGLFNGRVATALATNAECSIEVLR